MSSWPAWEHLYTPVVSCSVRYPLPAWGAYPCRRQCLCTLSGWPPADWGLLAGLSARLPFGLPEEIQTARERTQAPLNASLPSVRYAPNTQGRGRKDPISVLPAGWRATAHSWPTLPSMGVGLPRGEARPLLPCRSHHWPTGPCPWGEAAHWLSRPCGLLPSTVDDPLHDPLSARSLCLAHELVSCFTGTDGCEGIIWLCPWRVHCHWWRAPVALASAAVSHAATTWWLGASSHLRAFAALPLMRAC